MKKLAFGLMRLPMTENTEKPEIDINRVCKMVDTFIERGFTYFDTAWVYHGGFSEKIFGELVAKRYPREQFQVVSKMPVWELKEESDLERIFEEQLKKCNIEYFDYYFLHSLGTGNYESAEKFHGFEFIQKMKAEGKIKHIGFSFHDNAEKLDQILTKHPEIELVQLQINYIDWESDNVQSRKCYEVAMKHNKMVAIMEPIKGGSLANIMDDAKKLFTDYNPNASVASWAVRYAASLDNILVVLSGMSNMEQLNDNMSYMKDFVPLSAEEQDVVAKATEGVTIRDPKYMRNKEGAEKRGILFGAYHFFSENSDPIAQAENFLKTAQLKNGNLVPVLDVEVRDRFSRGELRENVLKWLQHVENHLGKKPMIYTYAKFHDEVFCTEEFEDYHFWIAHYGVDKPINDCVFWQFTEEGVVYGIKGYVDIDVYLGSVDRFHDYILDF